MDPLTHAVLGANIGRAFFSRPLGNRAIWLGALAATIPDLDMLSLAFGGPWAAFVYHRGPSHSIWFGTAAGVLCGWTAWRIHGRSRDKEPPQQGPDPPSGAGAGSALPGSREARRAWIGLFALAFLSQPFLDVFTSYGTQILAPLSRHRFSLYAVEFIDPVYSGILAASLLFQVLAPAVTRNRIGRRVALAALVLSTAWLLHALWLNGRADRSVRRYLSAEGIHGERIQCYPTRFNPYLRRFVARAGDEVLVGHASLWPPSQVNFRRFTVQDHPLIEGLRETLEGRLFEWFTSGEVAVRVIPREDGFTVEMDDLRYGIDGPPDQGPWGIRVEFDLDGRQASEVTHFHRHEFHVREYFAPLWRAITGAESESPHVPED